MAKRDVTKAPFSQKSLDGFFWNFIGRHQIDAGEGTKRFKSISAAVLSYRENPAGWGDIRPPPPAGRGLNHKKQAVSYSIFFSSFVMNIDILNTFRKSTIAKWRSRAIYS